MKEYTEIEVTQDHIIDGVEECSQNCAVAVALINSDLISDNEWANVCPHQGPGYSSLEITKEYKVGNEFLQTRIEVHPEDIKNVLDFIDWFDSGGSVDSKNIHLPTLTFRAKIGHRVSSIDF